MWSGSIVNIPTTKGWFLCNGQNGTPNLVNRFIVGSGDTYSVGNTGGSSTVTLTTAQIPSHSHPGTAVENGAHVHSITDPGHVHQYDRMTDLTDRADLDDNQFRTANSQANTGSAVTGITINSGGAHTHSVTTNNIGGGEAHENRPPYYSLAYIMRVF